MSDANQLYTGDYPTPQVVDSVEADYRHVAPTEALEAADASIADGSPHDARVRVYADDWVQTHRWAPTRKLRAAIIVAVLAYASAKVAPLDADLEHLLNVLAPLVAAWWTTNDDTPGGVPPADSALIEGESRPA